MILKNYSVRDSSHNRGKARLTRLRGTDPFDRPGGEKPHARVSVEKNKLRLQLTALMRRNFTSC